MEAAIRVDVAYVLVYRARDFLYREQRGRAIDRKSFVGVFYFEWIVDDFLGDEEESPQKCFILLYMDFDQKPLKKEKRAIECSGNYPGLP